MQVSFLGGEKVVEAGRLRQGDEKAVVVVVPDPHLTRQVVAEVQERRRGCPEIVRCQDSYFSWGYGLTAWVQHGRQGRLLQLS